MKLAYIAGPFRGKSHWDVACNVRSAETLALEVWRLGVAALCPHTNTAHFQDAAPDHVWLEGTLVMLRRCDAVVLTPDWRRSSGARAEVREAIKLGIPVFENFSNFRYWADGFAESGDVKSDLQEVSDGTVPA